VTPQRKPRTLRADSRGSSAVEFGLVAPVLFGLVMGSMQLSIDVYVNAVLKGAVQQAGRNSGIEDAMPSQTAIDNKVKAQVHAVLPQATVTFTRKNYLSFSDVGKAEDFIDSNHNSVHDATECFYDENANNIFDDGAVSGQGGARDVVVYKATVEYNELLPLKALMGMSDKRKLSASTTLMNQPFATQGKRVTKQVCPS
jgi:hypothetical protein